MKNELNAILHFIKFIRRTRNLAVIDPAFNSTLDNTFSIDDVRRQTEDKNLVAQVKEIAQKYNGMGRMCSDRHEYNDMSVLFVLISICYHVPSKITSKRLVINRHICEDAVRSITSVAHLMQPNI